MATSDAKMSLKLLIDTKAKRVLFAEASKDFIDFLFSLFHLPVGTVVSLLTKRSMVGTLGNLYNSIENLSQTYLQPNYHNKSLILNPKPPISGGVLPTLLLDLPPSVDKSWLLCSADCRYNGVHPFVADDPRAVCPSCHSKMSRVVSYVAPPAAVAGELVSAAGEEGGFVKGMVTYMVMDDLVVTPMSTISSITMLNKFNVKEVGALEEKVIELGMAEGLKILKASLLSKTVLTDVFLGNEGA